MTQNKINSNFKLYLDLLCRYVSNFITQEYVCVLHYYKIDYIFCELK